MDAPEINSTLGRTATLVSAGKLDVTEHALPRPGPSEVLLRVHTVGICGTDVHAFRGRSAILPVVLGHDFAAVIVAVGANVTALRVGARVTADPTLMCGNCGFCRAGRPEVCPSGTYLGMTTDGVLADFVCLPAASIIELSDAVTDEHATLLEPVAVALHLLERIRSVVAPSAPAVIVGGGPLGIVVAQVLRQYGHGVTVLEPQEHRRRISSNLGLEVRPPGPVALPQGPRLVVETSATSAGFELATELATSASTIVLVGRAPGTIDAQSVLLNELAVIGVRGGPGLYPQAIGMLATGTIQVAPLITHRFELEHAQDAFEAVVRPQSSVVRALVSCTG